MEKNTCAEASRCIKCLNSRGILKQSERLSYVAQCRLSGCDGYLSGCDGYMMAVELTKLEQGQESQSEPPDMTILEQARENQAELQSAYEAVVKQKKNAVEHLDAVIKEVWDNVFKADLLVEFLEMDITEMPPGMAAMYKSIRESGQSESPDMARDAESETSGMSRVWRRWRGR